DDLPVNASDTPLVRLYDFKVHEASELLAAVNSLAHGSKELIAVHDLPWITPLGGCRLTFHVRSWNQGLVRVANPAEFECGLSLGTWDNVAGFVEPFAVGSGGFQWLWGGPETAALLLSVDGDW